MFAEYYLKKQGVPFLINDDKGIKDIDKATWLNTAFSDATKRAEFLDNFHYLENHRTIADPIQREHMTTYIGKALNNPYIPADIKTSLQRTNEELTKIGSIKSDLDSYLSNAENKKKDKAAKLAEYNQKTRYYIHPDNIFVRAADGLDNAFRILGQHTPKPTILKSPSATKPGGISLKNTALNFANQLVRAPLEGTVGAGTDFLRKLGGAPLEHLRGITSFTIPAAIGALTSTFIDNPYIEKKAAALRKLMNPSQVYAEELPEDMNAEALFNRYPTFTNAFLNQEIEDPRITDRIWRVKLPDVVDMNGKTPYVNKFKKDIYPFLQYVDNTLADRGYSEADRDQFLSAMSPEDIQNYLYKNIYGFSSFEEQQDTLNKYLKNKGLDEETAEAYQKLLNDYFSHFDPKKGMAPPLFMQKGENDYDVTPYMQALIDYMYADKDSGSAFTGGFAQGSIAGGSAGALAGFALGKGRRIKNAIANGIKGAFAGGATSGIIDATRAASFNDDVLSIALPEPSQAAAFPSYLVNLNDFSDNSLKSANSNNNNPLNVWKNRVNWQAPEINKKITNIKSNIYTNW